MPGGRPPVAVDEDDEEILRFLASPTSSMTKMSSSLCLLGGERGIVLLAWPRIPARRLPTLSCGLSAEEPLVRLPVNGELAKDEFAGFPDLEKTVHSC